MANAPETRAIFDQLENGNFQSTSTETYALQCFYEILKPRGNDDSKTLEGIKNEKAKK